MSKICMIANREASEMKMPTRNTFRRMRMMMSRINYIFEDGVVEDNKEGININEEHERVVVRQRSRAMSSLLIIKLLLSLISIFFFLLLPAANGQLTVGFYNSSCPSAESLVQQAVAAAFANNSGVAPGLIRLHFHDCFVRTIRLLDQTTSDQFRSEFAGCDGSVLIDSTSGNKAEKDAPANNPSLHGFEVIDAAKSAIEAKCPNTVSCADILAFAARDSINLTGNLSYSVPSGRRDGTVSNSSEATANLPSPLFNSSQLISNFAAKNLTADEMVTLSGAHTVGVSHCSAFTNRLYNFSSTSQTDPTLSLAYARLLQSVCPFNSSSAANTTVALDIITQGVLDNKYYVGLQNNLGLLTSDHALLTDSQLSASVQGNVNSQANWTAKFVAAMLKMGKIQVLTGTQGQIRTNCRVVNNASSLASHAGSSASVATVSSSELPGTQQVKKTYMTISEKIFEYHTIKGDQSVPPAVVLRIWVVTFISVRIIPLRLTFPARSTAMSPVLHVQKKILRQPEAD
ncbi:Peroxidase 5 [Apostasia shenzhenica]|uniref:peroxidase n=1 Tax=Apostasia shenzhenica TaxID=1088818 RepID=A0A2I0A027_9ASPA|nr:Peroxidase 5 [Apostasia shenzhenica]